MRILYNTGIILTDAVAVLPLKIDETVFNLNHNRAV